MENFNNKVIITDSAVKKINNLLSEEEDKNLNLRMFIQGGGCSGLQYGFTFDNLINEDDVVIEKNNLKILVDYFSVQYLEGAEIDFVDGLEGTQFVIKNPNAKTTCGCGSSFSV